MKKVFSLLLCLLVLLSLATPVFAAGSTITVKYDKKALFSFDVVSEYHETDLFDNFKNVMPGDKLEETITVKNSVWNHDYIKVYFKAKPHNALNPLAYDRDQAAAEGKKDETIATMEAFLKQLDMTIYDSRGNVVYTGKALNAPDKSISLGTIRKNKSMDFTVKIEVPLELGNEFASRVGEVDWVFTVEARNDPSDTPKTGDYVIVGAVALMAVSGAALLVLLIGKRRKNRK